MNTLAHFQTTPEYVKPHLRLSSFIWQIIILAVISVPFEEVISQTVVKVMVDQPVKLESSLGPDISAGLGELLVVSDRLTVTGGTPPLSYAWMAGNTQVASGNTFQIVADAPGNYSVVVTDSRGCTSTSVISLSVGMNDVYGEKINIYPIPAGDYVIIDVPDFSEPFMASLATIYGQIVWKGKINSGESLKTKYPPGIYFLRLTIGNKLIIKKIIIS